jgi:hypothetical protein
VVQKFVGSGVIEHVESELGTPELHHDDEAIGKISVLLTRFLLFSITRTQPNLDQGLNCRDATRSELRRLACFAGFHPCRV